MFVAILNHTGNMYIHETYLHDIAEYNMVKISYKGLLVLVE